MAASTVGQSVGRIDTHMRNAASVGLAQARPN